MALPSNVSFGTVVGRFMRAVADGPDTGRDPDGIPLAGLTVKFIPSVDRFKNATATPPVMIVADPITAATDADGYLIDAEGEQGIRLLATDDEDLNPTGWTWGVAISGTGFRTVSFSFALPTDGTVDLATVIPVPGNPGQAMQDWLAAVEASQTAAADALVARDEAVAAKDAAEAVPAQVDTAMAAQASDPESEFSTVLTHTIAKEVQPVADAVVATAVAGEDIPGKVAIAIAAQAGKIIQGVGMPNGVVTAAPGTLYVDTASTNGASVWRKATGTGNTGWAVVDGDSGWRNITPGALPSTLIAGSFFVRRIGLVTTLRLSGLQFAALSAPANLLNPGIPLPIPFGTVESTSRSSFTIGDIDISEQDVLIPYVAGGSLYLRLLARMTSTGMQTTIPAGGKARSGSVSWVSPDAWPTSLPGTPA